MTWGHRAAPARRAPGATVATEHDGWHGRARAGLIAACVVALAARLVWIAVADLAPDEGFHFDMSWYHTIAQRIAAGHGMTRLDGAPTAEWPPGYPVTLAAVYALSNSSVVAGQILNAALSTLTCAFIGLIAARLFGWPTGLTAAALWALFPGDVYYSPLLMSEVMFATALTGACLLAVRLEISSSSPPGRLMMLGVAIALATLVRGATLAFPLAIAALWLVGTCEPKKTLVALAIVVVGMLAGLAPWAVRNQIRLGEPVLVATSLGRTLAHAHSPAVAAGKPGEALRSRIAFWKKFDDIEQPRRELEINRAWTRESLGYMISHPMTELRLIPTRFVGYYRHDHEALAWGRRRDTAAGRSYPLVEGIPDRAFSVVADAYLYVVAALALAGSWLVVRTRDMQAGLIVATIAYFTVLHSVLMPGHPRYHHCVLPFLTILAAVALNALARGVARRREPLRSAA